MDSKVVQGAAAALLAALTLAALAWGIKIFVEAVALVNSMLVSVGVSTFSGRLVVFILSAIIVTALAGGGYFLFNKWLKREQDSSSG